MTTSTQMSFDDWEKTFQPGERITDFNTVPDLAKDKPLRVWTEIECDGVRTITNGYHLVNREAYYITAVAYAADVFIEVDDTDEDEAALDDEQGEGE
jgi:hypothetical protein